MVAPFTSILQTHWHFVSCQMVPLSPYSLLLGENTLRIRQALGHATIVFPSGKKSYSMDA